MSQLVRSNQALPEAITLTPRTHYPIASVVAQVVEVVPVRQPVIPPTPPKQDTYAKTAVIAALSVFGLVVAVLIGVMIGRSDRSTPKPVITPTPSPSPQVIVVPQQSTPQGCQVLCFGGN